MSVKNQAFVESGAASSKYVIDGWRRITTAAEIII
jgi:hypothetical protein